MNHLQIFMPLAKVDEEKREVWGRAAIETPDHAKEIFDYETSKPFFEKWSQILHKATNGKSLGNVRAMHGKTSAGKLTHIEYNDVEKAIDVCAKIVDDNEWKKVKEGVYTGFSIGGSYAKRWKDGALMRYTANPSEISVVDLPCMPGADFLMVKSDGSQLRKNFNNTSEEGLEGGQVIAEPEEMQKGMYSVGILASLLGQLKSLQEDAQFEKEIEGDKSNIPQRLQDAVGKLGNILRDMVTEEVSEMSTTEKAAQVEDLAKIDPNAELLKRFDAMNASLDKVVEGNKALTELNKTLQDDNLELKKRISTLESQPETPKAMLKAVEKGQDYEEVEPELNKSMDEAEKSGNAKPEDLIKMIHNQGGYLALR